MKFKYKVPCDEIFHLPEFGAVIDGKASGDPIDEEMGVHFGGDDNFPQGELCVDKTISFEFQMGDPVGLWCYAKTKKDAKAMVDYLAYLTGEVPSDVYHRWIFEV